MQKNTSTKPKNYDTKQFKTCLIAADKLVSTDKPSNLLASAQQVDQSRDKAEVLSCSTHPNVDKKCLK